MGLKFKEKKNKSYIFKVPNPTQELKGQSKQPITNLTTHVILLCDIYV